MSDEEYWQAVLRRDQAYDERFVYGVKSTGIYCRPSCPARRPGRDRVRFFSAPAEAEQAGFRACRRCQPDRAIPEEPNLALAEQICRYLEQAHEQPPSLEHLGQRFHLSPHHLQRTFRRIVGVTPRQYAAAARQERFRVALREGMRVTDALYEAGYTSCSSAYARSGAGLGMTPTRYRGGSQRVHIAYTIAPCSLGSLLVAATDEGLCAVRLGDSEAELERLLQEEFPLAAIRREDAGLGGPMSDLLAYLDGERPHLDLPLDVQATAFQRRVWDALRAIPYGTTSSYKRVAQAIGQPTAVRAVAQACAHNPAALVIPCHRVIREDGTLGGYRWGLERKEALLDQEARRSARTTHNA